MNKGRGVPLCASSAVSTFYFSNDILVVRWKREVVEDGGLGRTHGQVFECGAVAVCRQRGSRSKAANDGVAGTAPVRWTVAIVERQR